MDKKIVKVKMFERPLDNIVGDGGYLSIFKTICVVGDSLSSGEIEYYGKVNNDRHCFDMYDRSWGAYIEKMTGSKVSFMSYGGASASSIIANAKNNNYFSKDYYAEAYIIALGYNDMLGCAQKTGTMDDIHNPDSKSFAFYYYFLLSKLKEINPYARFFFVDMPKTPFWPKEKKKRIVEMRNMLISLTHEVSNAYLIDLYKHGPIHDKKFKAKYYQADHLNFEGYYLTAKIICSYIDYIIRKNPRSFFEQEYYEDIAKNYKDLIS